MGQKSEPSTNSAESPRNLDLDGKLIKVGDNVWVPVIHNTANGPEAIILKRKVEFVGGGTIETSRSGWWWTKDVVVCQQ